MGSVTDFLPRARTLDSPRVLELGTKRSIESRSTRHEFLLPNAGEWIGTDVEAGVDVDVVADAHAPPELSARSHSTSSCRSRRSSLSAIRISLRTKS